MHKLTWFYLCFTILSETAIGRNSWTDQEALETLVWNGEERHLFTIEQKVARAIQENPQSGLGHYLMAHTLTRIFSSAPGNVQLLRQAAQLAEQAIELEPRSEYGYVALADLLDLMGQTEKANAILDAAEHKVEIGWRTLLVKARLSSDQEEEKTLTLLQRSLEQPGAIRGVIIPYVLAVILAKENDTLTVDAIENKISEWNTRFPHYLFDQALAQIYIQKKQYDRASKLYQTIYDQHPDRPEVLVNQGILLHKYLNRSSRAITLLKMAIERYPALESKLAAAAHLYLGDAHLKLNDQKNAVREFGQSLKLSHNVEATIEFVGRSYREKKLHMQLVHFLEHVDEEVPGIALSYALLGETLSEKLGKHRDALEAFDDAIALAPDKSELYNGKGLTYFRMNAVPEALQQFSTAVKIDPSDASAYYNEACALAKLKRSDDALISLDNAFSLNPVLQRSAQTDHDLDSLRSNPRFKTLLNDHYVGH